jgi:hypothetical protein
VLLLRLYPPCAGVPRPAAFFRDGATRVLTVASRPVSQLRMTERSRLILLRLTTDRARRASWKRRIVDGRIIRYGHEDTIPAYIELET